MIKKDFGTKDLNYHTLTRSIPLSQKIVLLVSIVVLFAILPSSVFTTLRVAKVIYDRVSINAVSINSILCNSNEIIEGISGTRSGTEQEVSDFMFDYVNHVDDSDEASVAIFNINKELAVYYNPARLDGFRESARELVEQYCKYETITYSQNYAIPNKAIGFVTDKTGKRVGYVVTGYSNELFNNSTIESIIFLGICSLFGLFIGIIGAVYLARHIKKILFGLEPQEIATLLQERNVILNSVREGVINVNVQGIITLINQEALALLSEANAGDVDSLEYSDAKDRLPGIPWDEIIGNGRMLTNVPLNLGDNVFMVTAVPIFVQQNIIGAVVTFRRKSDVFELANQLTGFKNYATALRAQTHEFMNKMHVIMGLIDMKAYDDLKKYTKEIAQNRQSEVSYVVTRLKDITLAGFVLGKMARSRELAVEFTFSEESELHSELIMPSVHDLVLIIGNLIENAFDALRNYEGERIMNLSIIDFDKEIVIEVEDSGPGIKKSELKKIFQRGYSNKGAGHGFGLYLVKHSIENLDGTISVESEPGEGTIFTVRLPVKKRGETNV